jgi:hypothetical protein
MDVTSFKRNASLERVVPWTVLQIQKKQRGKKMLLLQLLVIALVACLGIEIR